MNIIKFSIENLDFLLHVPDSKVPEMNAILSSSGEIPLEVTLNEKNFVMMSEEKFAELLELDDDYYDSEYTEDFMEDCEEEITIDEIDSILLRLIHKEYLGDTLLSSVMSSLDEKNISVAQLSRLEQIVSAQHLLAIEREKLGEECQ